MVVVQGVGGGGTRGGLADKPFVPSKCIHAGAYSDGSHLKFLIKCK